MKYIQSFQEGDHIGDVYLCKHRQCATSRNGKSYENVTLQDKTGTIDCKVWDPGAAGIEDFKPLDYVYITGEVTSFNNSPFPTFCLSYNVFNVNPIIKS